jgi:large subunit ribosomal protein L25
MLDINSTIIAQGRVAGGKKGAARKLRAMGRVPAIAYGPKQAPRHLSLDPKMFPLQRMRFGLGHLYDVQVSEAQDGGPASFKCLIRDIQSDPVTRKLLHVDLYAVDMASPLSVDVEIELVGKAAGIIEGGLLSQILRSVEVICLPHQIPAKLVADVTPLGVGDSLHLSDIKLPEGVKFTAHHDEAVALVVEPDAAPATPAEDAAAAGAAPAAGAAAAKTPDKK